MVLDNGHDAIYTSLLVYDNWLVTDALLKYFTTSNYNTNITQCLHGMTTFTKSLRLYDYWLVINDLLKYYTSLFLISIIGHYITNYFLVP